jgi:hypothetical protein
MKMHRVVLDISALLVHLDSPTYGKISLQMPHVARLQASIYIAIVKSLDEIPVVQEYPDVFPDDLPECLLIGSSNSRSSCGLVLPLFISDHILWHRMRWQN